MKPIKAIEITSIENKIIQIRDEDIILDSDVAKLYSVEARDINKAVKNNINKFPEEYVFEISDEELKTLRWKFSTAKLSKTIMQKSGELIADILDDSLENIESERTIELNLAVLKFKHTLKKNKKTK